MVRGLLLPAFRMVDGVGACICWLDCRPLYEDEPVDPGPGDSICRVGLTEELWLMVGCILLFCGDSTRSRIPACCSCCCGDCALLWLFCRGAFPQRSLPKLILNREYSSLPRKVDKSTALLSQSIHKLNLAIFREVLTEPFFGP